MTISRSVSTPSPISSSSSSSIGAPSDDESEGEGEYDDDEVQTSESGPERIELAESNRAAEEEVMTSKKVIAICQFGGEFFADEDGSMSMVYNGGNAYAIHLDDQTNLNDFRREVAKTFDLDVSAFPSSISSPTSMPLLALPEEDDDE
ncbi:hypothetical protein QQ045_017384 [Rhodiola kirilowii]